MPQYQEYPKLKTLSRAGMLDMLRYIGKTSNGVRTSDILYDLRMNTAIADRLINTAKIEEWVERREPDRLPRSAKPRQALFLTEKGVRVVELANNVLDL